MATRIERLIEADRRGLLTGERKAKFDEAVNRGLITLPEEPEQPRADIGQFRAGVEESLLGLGQQLQEFKPRGGLAGLFDITPAGLVARQFGLTQAPPEGEEPSAIAQAALLPFRAARGLVGMGAEALTGRGTGELIAERQAALPEAPAVGEEGRFARTAGRITGAGLPFAPLGLVGGARGLATELAATQLAGVGGAAGEQLGGPAGEIIGTLAGGLSPFVAAGTIRRTVRGGRRGKIRAQEAIARSERLGAPTPTLGEISQNRAIKGFENFSRDSTILGPRLSNTAEAQIAAIERNLDELTTGLAGGVRAEPQVAGRIVQEVGFPGFVRRARAKEGKLHNQFQKLVPENRAVAINSAADGFESIGVTPALETMLSHPKLPNIRTALLEGGDIAAVPYAELKRFRSMVGEKLSGFQVLSDVPRGDLKFLYKRLSDDMLKAAEDAGPQAVRAFKRSNKFSAALHDRVDSTIAPLLRKNEFEDVFQAIITDTVKDRGGRVQRTFRSLKPEQRKILASSLIANMGKSRPGAAVEAGEFAVDTFLTNWNKMVGDPRIKRAVTNAIGDPQQIKALDDVVEHIKNVRAVRKVGANPSGTAARTISAVATIGTPVAAVAWMANLFTPGVAAAIVAGYSGARLANVALTNPTIVKWMAKSTKLRLNQMPRHMAQLAQAVRDADPEVQAAAQHLINTYNQSLNVFRANKANTPTLQVPGQERAQAQQ